MRRAAAFIVAVALAVRADDTGPSPTAEAAPPIEAALPATAAVAPPTSSLAGSQALYQAYNELHALSQQFDTPIHSPAVVVVGRQTDGKSALIEALMGFQFNHVGGGTKTRRPIAMQMHYHPDCELPRCYLQTAAGEQQLSLADLQAHIERENQRLEASKSFDAAEIIVRIEYKYCPNLLIIDTPGLLTPLSRSAAEASDLTNPNQPLGPPEAAQARQVEQLVRAKMGSPEHIILCVEETNNWHLAPARRLVMEADPALERTVCSTCTAWARHGHGMGTGMGTGTGMGVAWAWHGHSTHSMCTACTWRAACHYQHSLPALPTSTLTPTRCSSRPSSTPSSHSSVVLTS